MNTGMTRIGGTRGLCMPPQVAPVDRRVVGSALTHHSGVEPSDFWSDLAKTALPILGQVATQALPALFSAI